MERQPLRRRRPAMSCLECRRRKIKYDRNDPCSHCTFAKIQCTYKFYRNNEPVISQQPQRSSPLAHTPSLPNQAQQPSINGSTIHHVEYLPGPQVAAAAGQKDVQTPGSVQVAESSLCNLLQQVQKLQMSSASGLINGLSETSRDIIAHQSGVQRSQIILNKSRVLGASHRMGMAQEV